MFEPNLHDRVIGSVLGLALGDALGAPFEFRRRVEIPMPIPAFELPWLDRPPGSTTDDTAMARNLIRSLVERGSLDTRDVLSRHKEWFESDPPDVGAFTRRVLAIPASIDDGARLVWEERGPEVSAGNGSVMYCAPLGAAYAHRPELLFGYAPALSAITHYDGRCRTACLAVTLAVAALVRGEPAPVAVRSAVDSVLDREGGEELEYLVDEAGRARPVDGPDQGFCLFAAGLALRTTIEASSVEEGLLDVVALGGDTDTNAAVAGALLGARDGGAALPGSWLERLADRHAIEEEASALATLAESIS
jgi:ADP-ribosyl-[dinitrogen reductase] hydrolase